MPWRLLAVIYAFVYTHPVDPAIFYYVLANPLFPFLISTMLLFKVARALLHLLQLLHLPLEFLNDA